MYVLAWQVTDGDQVLMPDDTTWYTVESVATEPDGSLLLLFAEGGSARRKGTDEVTVKRPRRSCG
ncbi:hypothetical protein LCGC14_2638980 [marine sediment metagenome]|uniref:Uncharacterized protein n=1 Tax=marine sediment metagenome TaxID=412755 RepID=A0A0F8ZY86_9ZZZZ